MTPEEKPLNRYLQLIEDVFFANYRRGLTEFTFERSDLETSAEKLGIVLPECFRSIHGQRLDRDF